MIMLNVILAYALLLVIYFCLNFNLAYGIISVELESVPVLAWNH